MDGKQCLGKEQCLLENLEREQKVKTEQIEKVIKGAEVKDEARKVVPEQEGRL